MRMRNVFISALIFVMAVLLATPLMAQVNYNTIMDPEFEEYHNLAEMAKTTRTPKTNTFKIDMNTIMDPEFEEYHDLAEGKNALFINAAKVGKLWKVKLLLITGVDVNAIDGEGRTALMYAAQNGHTEVVEKLLKQKNINVNAQDNEDISALMYAAMNEHEDIVNLLINKGKADKTLTSKKGFMAYDYAAQDFNETMALKNKLEGNNSTDDDIIVDLDYRIRVLSNIMNQTKVFNINNETLEKTIKHIKQQNGESMRILLPKSR